MTDSKIKPITAAPTNYIKDAADWLENIPPPSYLASPILQMGQLVSLTAPTNAGKSAATATMFCGVVGGLNLGGIQFRKGKVLALLGENAENFKLQLKAAQMRYGLKREDIEGMIHVYDYCESMERTLVKVKNEVLQKGLGPFALVSIDTVAAYFGGEDENSNAQLRRHASLMREFTKPAFGSPCVLANSHPTKNPSRDNLLPRGGGAFLAEIDSNLTLWNDDGILTIGYTKLRGRPFDPIQMSLEEQQVGFSDGTTTEVAVAVVISDADAKARRVKTRNEDEVLVEVIAAKPDGSMSDWARAMGWVMQNGHPYHVKVVRALKRLEKEGKVKRDGAGNYSVKGK